MQTVTASTQPFNASERRSLRGAALLAGLAVMVLVCVLSAGGLLRPLKDLLQDERFELAARRPTDELLLVDIDENSIHRLGAWPWNRTIHAAVIDKLRALGAADIAFDVDFSSPSTPDGDAALEAALKRADGSVVLAALQQISAQGSSGRSVLLESRPLARFAEQSWEGTVDVWPDPDGRMRWFSRGEAFGTERLPSLAALVASARGPATGRFLIDFGIDASRLRHVSIADLLDGSVARSAVAGRKVIVGASAIELRDFFQVPRFGLMAGSLVQAMAVESLVQGRALQPIGMAPTLAATVLLLLVAYLSVWRLSYGRCLACFIGLAVLIEIAASALQASRPLVVDTAPAQAGLALFCVVAVAIEIAERHVRLRASRRQANGLRSILDRVVADNFAGIVVVDQAGLVRAASVAAATILGAPALVGAPYRSMLPDGLATLIDSAIERGLGVGAQPAAACEVEVVSAGGIAVDLECVVTVSRLFDGPNSGLPGDDAIICLTFRDVTEERRNQKRLIEMARVDALTGLASRAVFLEAADASQPSGEVDVAAILFDIDRFKIVNDRLGHAAGDALLEAVAARIRQAVEPGDIAARLGGDEFALLVRRASRPEIEDFAERLQETLAGAYDICGYQPSVSASPGVAFAEGQGTKELMSSADVALYAAKAAGGGIARIYDTAMRTAVEDGRQLEADLRQALHRSELQVHYQRQVDVVTEQIIGVEALLRWTHPDRGPISPAIFIPIAERTGLIDPIGAWVLATACRDAVRWSVPIKISVNLSAVQLAHSDFAQSVFAILADTGLHPGRLDLELTESLLMDNDVLIRNTLTTLRQAGVKISLDDFGTGYSSLSYLNTFSIDKIKIDQSFVRNLAGNPTARAIIRAVIGLARDLGLHVNAEGIETVEQLGLLRQLGCDEVQGYLHGRPEPSPAIEASLTAQLAKAA